MLLYIWYCAIVWYFTIDCSRNIIKHFYDYDVIFFIGTRKPDFSRSDDVLKALVKRAAKARRDHPTLSVPEAMRVTTYTLEESTDHTLQMRICRTSAPPPQAINVTNFSSSSTLSTLTPTVSTLPKPKRTRHTCAGAQQKCANDLKMNHHKAAHKRATSLYASKQSKPEGDTKMSASEANKLVFGEFGLEISKRTIQRDVAED
jgi:hypothetical protein